MPISHKEPIFELFAPSTKLIGVLSIPHSGEVLPEPFTPFLSKNTRQLMEDVDFRVHELIDIPKLNDAGIAIIKSNIIRVAIDLNRSKEKCFLTWKENSQGIKIVESEPDEKTQEFLIESYYSPYYTMLKTLITELKQVMSIASFIDLHSMPSTPTAYHFKQNPNQKSSRPDFCLSDNHGETCETEYINSVQKILKKSYKEVTCNDPYIGGYITTYANSIPDVNNIQIEINRAIYMDEKQKKLNDNLVSKLSPVLTNCLIETYETFWNKYKK